MDYAVIRFIVAQFEGADDKNKIVGSIPKSHKSLFVT